MTTLDDIEGMTEYDLAREASCGHPANPDSPGAALLTSVRDNIVAAVKNGDLDVRSERTWDRTIEETADGAPSDYTYPRWLEFIDLEAWQEIPDDYDAEPGDMTALAGIRLYMIAKRLCQALLESLAEDAEEEA